jgi:hypothetical protein
MFRLRMMILVVLMLVSAGVSAQNVLTPAQTGTIQVLRQDDGQVTISGRSYAFDDEICVVTLGGERIDAAVLDEGMVVRFSTDRRGNLLSLEILGPITKTEILQQN